jgi:hypothetical protein
MTVENSGNSGESRDEFSDAESLDYFTLGDITTEYTLPFMEFDSAMADVLNTAALAYVDKGSPKSVKELIHVARTLVVQFDTCVKTILNDTTDRQTRINDLSQLLLREDEERLKTFGLIAPCIGHEEDKWSEEVMLDMLACALDSNIDTQENIPILLTQVFGASLQQSLNHLLSHLDEETDEESEGSEEIEDGEYIVDGEFKDEEYDSAVRTFGGHVLDIIKTTVGVAGAIVIANVINKRLNRK